MAVRREYDALLPDDGQFPDEVGEDFAVAPGRGVADGVGEVDGGGAGFDGGLSDLFEKLELGATGILGREFNIAGVGQRLLDGLHADPDDLLLSLSQLVVAVNLGRGAEDVDAAELGGADGLAGAFDVFGRGAGQAADNAFLDDFGDCLDRLEVTLRGDGETGFDNVHAQRFELPGDLQLFVEIECGARGLLAIAECGVEDTHGFHDCSCSRLRDFSSRRVKQKTPAVSIAGATISILKPCDHARTRSSPSRASSRRTFRGANFILED